MNIKVTGDEFLNYVIDILSPLYQIKTLKMFGGYGIYINDKIIALIAKQELYLKINHKATEFFKKFDPEFFSYKKDNKIIKISYWKAPAKFLENQELLQQYLNISLQEYTND